MNRSLPLLLAAAGASAPLFAQTDFDGPSGPAPNLTRMAREWRTAHGQSWRVLADESTGFAEMIHGGAAAGSFQPRVDADWFTLARQFTAATADMHGIPGGTLVDDQLVLLPLSLAGSTDKYSVQLRQEVGGVPVDGAFVNLLFSMDGSLLSIHSTAAPRFSSTSTTPTLDAGRAATRAAALFTRNTGLAPITIGEPALAFVQIEGARGRVAALAWLVDMQAEQAGETPVGWRYSIDATSGILLDLENQVHNFDVTGTVTTNTTPGLNPDNAANPEVPEPMRYARVTSSAGTVFTDANGQFTYPGVNSPLSVTFEYVGTYNNVDNDAGAEYTLTTTLQPNQPNTVLLNPSSATLVTAQANAFQSVNEIHDWVKSVDPSDTSVDFTVVSNANLDANCNAFFNGNSINFFTSGGSCANTAYSTIVAHELGHWFNVIYNTGNGSDGMGEGNSDVWGMYAYDTPIIGDDFCGNGCNIRSGLNNRQYCGDTNPGCYGQVHADGEVWMGAAWKVRNNLNAALGGSAGDLAADTLFLGWMNGFNQTGIHSIIEIQWLTLDDDDGNIDNGTPNYTSIDPAFRIQGFPGFDLSFIEFQNVTPISDTTDETGPYALQAIMQATFNPPIITATARYRTGSSGAFSSVPLLPLGGNLFDAQIPGQDSPSLVQYYIEATDSLGNTNSFPSDGPAAPLEFAVGIVTTFLDNDFEGASNDNWTVGAAGDTATTGIWQRVDPVGTSAQPEDDHSETGTVCWVTGQQPAGGALGTNDVDGGATTLNSAMFDAEGLENPVISYWRWYSNNTGAVPNADIFEVEISNDGGSTWSSVETVGPGGSESNGGWFLHEFNAASILTPTNNMQMRFRASDLGDGSLVEAALDDIRGRDIAASCADPVNYCVGAPNSTGLGGQIGTTGSPSVADNGFGLLATDCPPQVLGIFFYGGATQQMAFGDGFMCVNGQIFRLGPAVMTDAFGQTARAVDLTSPPQPAGQITADSTWFFQFWHRDMSGPGGTGFNLTNGVEVTFCD